MRTTAAYLFLFVCLAMPAEALRVTQKMQTEIGIFDACEQTISYGFYGDKDYDFKTSIRTTGTFGTLYPFRAEYHSVGTYNKGRFMPQNYFQEAFSRFRHRTKEIVYEKGIPQRRISTKNDKKRIDKIITDAQYGDHIDLLSTFAMLAEQFIREDSCNFEHYSFNGKRYTVSKVKDLGKERIKTPLFTGRARKCEYYIELTEDATASFLLDESAPIYFWVAKDPKTKAPFIARVKVDDTPFGELEAVTTELEVKK